MPIRRLDPLHAEAFAALRAEALLVEPLAFASSPEDDVLADVERVREHLGRAPEAVVFGAFEPELVAVAGLYRDGKLKCAHKAHLWGVYVQAAFRRRGLALQLLQATLAHARSLPAVDRVHLIVAAEAPAARGLYESLGFRAWGVEPDALRWGDSSTDDVHMSLQL